jgi:hypothetical protein
MFWVIADMPLGRSGSTLMNVLGTMSSRTPLAGAEDRAGTTMTGRDA